MKKRDGIPNKIALTILLSFGAVFLVLLFDYFNLSKYVNINVSNFNLDGISLIIGNLVVVALFLLTYFLIDARSVKKEANKRNIALVILKSTYASCKEMAIIFEDEDSRTKAAQKCDFNKVIHEDKVMMRYLNIPFEENDMVLEFTKDGILSAEEFNTYTKIKKQYQKYVSLSIMFFDKYSLAESQKQPLYQLIDTATESINREISLIE